MSDETVKKATHRGYQIAYEVVGDGPPVAVQHGIFCNRRDWIDYGVTPALGGYQLLLIDSLGHGDSDKPDDPVAYTRQLRAGDIAAVLDQEGIDRAHYFGYSMGAWMGTGVAIHHPHRLLSLTLGGWDPAEGPKAFAGELSNNLAFEAALAYASREAPALTAWVTDDVKPGLAACFAALSEVEGAPEAIRNCGVPVFMPNGVDDPFHNPAKALASRLDKASFLSVPGDHITAWTRHGPGLGQGIRAFLDRVPR